MKTGTRSAPSTPLRLRRPNLRQEVALIFAGWTAVGLLFGSSSYLRGHLYGEPRAVSHVASVAAVDVYSWATIMVVAFWATRRYPLLSERWPRHVAIFAGLALVLVTLRALGLHYFLQSTGEYPVRTVAQALVGGVPVYFVSFWMLVGVAHAVELARRFRARELSTAQLEMQLTRTQLQMLKMQLHPHFLFNTLHAISTLVHRDPDAAERMIASLSELLRATLTHQQAQEVTVREEMDLLNPYLEIEKTRLGDRLQLHIQVDPDTREARMPHLLLQPLVENAIRHGIAPRRQGGTVTISVVRSGERLALEVRDNGQGFAAGAVMARLGGGVGLGNTRARLEQLYGTGHRFSVSSVPGRGTRVEIEIPLRVTEGAAELAGVGA